MHLALRYAFGRQRSANMGGRDAKFHALALMLEQNVEGPAPGRHLTEWRRSTVSVLVDGSDQAVSLKQETGWSCIIRIGLVWQRDVGSCAYRRRRQCMKHLFAFAQQISIEGIHRQDIAIPIPYPHAFNIFATRMTHWYKQWHMNADEYYIQFTVNQFDIRPPPDLPHGIRKACCDSALDVCPICMEKKPDPVCFSCGQVRVTMCIDCMNKMRNKTDFPGYMCPLCPTDFDELSFYSAFTVESDCPQG